ncbi:hypothetical protein A2U01_0078884, partial [Trifolium medium]|nr:hypothetical protein [Trifolium medium]
ATGSDSLAECFASASDIWRQLATSSPALAWRPQERRLATQEPRLATERRT